MKVYKRQRGVLLLTFTAIAVTFIAATLSVSLLRNAKGNAEHTQRQKIYDVVSLVPEMSEALLRNPALWVWDENNAANFMDAIEAVGFVLPQDLKVYIGAEQAQNNIGFRNYLICRRCPGINPFNGDGTFDIANIPANVEDYYLINGYQLQFEGISRARKKLEYIATVFSKTYTSFRRQELEGILRCNAPKDSGECNYFRGCDFSDVSGVSFSTNNLLPCTEGETDNRLAATEFNILGGDAFSIWGNIFIYNSGGVNPPDREQPLALTTQGPFDIQVQLLVPQPI